MKDNEFRYVKNIYKPYFDLNVNTLRIRYIIASRYHCKIRYDKKMILEMEDKQHEANVRDRLLYMDFAADIERYRVEMYE
jgi:hypothetical protein